jgi:hypothetical protein
VLAPKAKQQQCARHCEFIFYSFSHLLFHYASQQDATPDCDVAVMGTKRDARPSTLSGCMEKGKRKTDGEGIAEQVSTFLYFANYCLSARYWKKAALSSSAPRYRKFIFHLIPTKECSLRKQRAAQLNF